MGAPGNGLESAPRLVVLGQDRAFTRLLGSFLVARGWQVKVLEDPRDLLARIERLAPDVVCLPLEGADPTGLELVALLACLARVPPVVLCTPQAGAANWPREALSALGVRAVLTRPVPFPALEATLAGCLPPEVRGRLVPRPVEVEIA